MTGEPRGMRHALRANSACDRASSGVYNARHSFADYPHRGRWVHPYMCVPKGESQQRRHAALGEAQVEHTGRIPLCFCPTATKHCVMVGGTHLAMTAHAKRGQRCGIYLVCMSLQPLGSRHPPVWRWVAGVVHGGWRCDRYHSVYLLTRTPFCPPKIPYCPSHIPSIGRTDVGRSALPSTP